MKRLLLFVLVSAVSYGFIMAQTPENKEIENMSNAQDSVTHVYKRHKERISVDGVKLSKEETYALLSNFRGVDYTQDWKKYASQQKLGVGLVSGGAAVAGICLTGVAVIAVVDVVAIMVSAGYAKPNNKNTINAFLAGAAVGAVAAGTGTYFLIHSGTRMKKIVRKMNLPESMAPEVAFGLQQHGIGLAVNF